MINLTGVGVEFGVQELYHEVNLFLGPEDRVGLVGPNGSGKSTILKMIAGLAEPTAGRVDIRRGTRIAYLPQTGAVVGDRTVLEEAMAAFSHVDRAQAEMREIEQAMKRPDLSQRELNRLLERYGTLQHSCHDEALDAESRAQKVLVNLGFSEADFAKRVATQSGGFQVRLTLARMLLSEPDLLLLDEPTNYLDIRSIEWLQEYLAGFRGAFLMVAHDRYLLDGLVERVWAIEGRRVLDFAGNYSEYLADKQQRDELQLKRYEEQQQFIRRTEDFIARFKARKDAAKRAQSRRRMLEKLERIEAPETVPEIRIRFPEAGTVHGKAFELRGAGKAFGGRRLFSGVNLAVAGGEKVGVFGPNGAGKTTLLRLIAGRLEPDEGSVWRSEKTRIAYYEQGAEEKLDGSLTVLESVAQAAETYTENELKGILGMFMFTGDMVGKKVGVLSGGERSRLAIIRTLLAPSNLLILDEPTNHLDIRSRETLIDAVAQYRRTVVFAAHDRFMLDRLATKTVRVEAGEVVLFPGNFAYAVGRKADSSAARPLPGETPAAVPRRGRDETARSAPPAPAGSRLFQLEQRLARVRQDYEAAVAAMEFARARALAQEQREVEAEIEARKADEVEEGMEQR